MRDTWGAPPSGWPRFDRDGRRIGEPVETGDGYECVSCGETWPSKIAARECCR